MIEKTEQTYWAKIYLSGPIEAAKQVIRAYCLGVGLCVTIEPTVYIYTGGEEIGYVVGLINYPRFPSESEDIKTKAIELSRLLLEQTYQHSALVMTPIETLWITKRDL